MFQYIIKLFKSLNNNSHPGEIAHGVACSLLLGFMPKDNVLWYMIFVFCLFLRINKAAYGIMIIVFSLLAPLLDSIFDIIGYYVLTFPAFENFFSWLLDIPFVAFTNFNNTIVMGSLVSGIILYVPVYWLARLFVKIWRHTLAPKIRNSKIFKLIGKMPLVKKITDMSTKIEELRK